MMNFLARIMTLDKIFHNAVGFVGVVAIFALLMLTMPVVSGLTTVLAAAAGYGLMRFMAYAKEAYDEARPTNHTRDLFDAESTIGGASLAVAFISAWIIFFGHV